jgi:hypothetical protein
MKKIIYSLFIVVPLLTGCGTKDTKNEAENYPTYDTTQKMENLNNAKNDTSQATEGDMRHNIDRK